jgi:hypothetical protein
MSDRRARGGGEAPPLAPQARPSAARERRAAESRATAGARTRPVTMNRNEESRLSSVSPLEMGWITRMPSSAENSAATAAEQAGAADHRRGDRVEVHVAAPLAWLAVDSSPPSAAGDLVRVNA